MISKKIKAILSNLIEVSIQTIIFTTEIAKCHSEINFDRSSPGQTSVLAKTPNFTMNKSYRFLFMLHLFAEIL